MPVGDTVTRFPFYWLFGTAPILAAAGQLSSAQCYADLKATLLQSLINLQAWLDTWLSSRGVKKLVGAFRISRSRVNESRGRCTGGNCGDGNITAVTLRLEKWLVRWWHLMGKPPPLLVRVQLKIFK